MIPREHTATFAMDRLPGRLVCRRGDIPLERVLDALDAPGELLKASAKSRIRRVGDWVLKGGGTGPIATLKRSILRARYRQGWMAACHLERHGVQAPRPYAFIEYGRLGIITRNILIMEYLDGCRNVEHFADAQLESGWREADVAAYLDALADAVNGLCASGAYHTDLAGKNILTRDGTSFWFIDLDGIQLNRPYTEQMRLRNHVQLYDSLCDRWDDRLLEPFIRRMLPEPARLADWMSAVRRAQTVRRARTLAIWHTTGQSESRG
ncbi:MAG: hypothetical protein JXR94_23595 [Candidatus Hydrogenedentes bacterium]|nr:hypothetical protein [Candidatus Hydrogenedentota bacterium]